MALSGSYNYTQTSDQLILDAFQLLGVYGNGRSVIEADMIFARNQLNKMIKAWMTQGLHLWAKEEAVLFLQANQYQYVISSDTTSANCALLSDTIVTVTSIANAVGDTLLTVLSTSGMLVGDYLGIVNPDNTVFWSTISVVNSSTSITLSDPLTQNPQSGALVYSYTTKLNKPLRVLGARRGRGYDNNGLGTISEVWMTPMAYDDYQAMTSKYVPGTPNQYCYVPQSTVGNMFLWQRPSDGNDRIAFTYERVLEDVDNIADNVDFPAEWLEPITWQLAVRLGPAWGRGQKVAQEILPIAEAALNNLKNWDNENYSVNFFPDRR